ncbi:MAG TPA: two-component sensor histidine kinase [Ruminococcaceae bacterium]|nr:two-component sensor histidine kinase [Oscillospiraceae bacterium]
MRQYGFDEVSYPDKNGAVFGALPYAALFVALLAAVFITMLLFLRAFFRRIVGLTEYAKRLQSRDYSLDIRDNDEGVISIYKNEIFKITGLLREQAEQSGTEKRMLSDTLYNISHQLKTPLTSLFVLTDLLNDGRDISERQEFIARIRAQLKRIEWLVSSLLKLSRLDSDTVIMKRQTLPLSKLVSRAAEPLLIPMELREQTLSLRGEDGIEITGDLNWLAEAVGNILKNCMEHTPKGGEITVSYEQNRLFRELRIEDTGGGIAPEDLPHIFERFYRGRRAGADSVGIGLAMAKSIIEKNGGSIQAYNSDAGAVFILRFMTD